MVLYLKLRGIEKGMHYVNEAPHKYTSTPVSVCVCLGEAVCDSGGRCACSSSLSVDHHVCQSASCINRAQYVSVFNVDYKIMWKILHAQNKTKAKITLK